MKNPYTLLLSGLSGSGKSTIIDNLNKKNSNFFLLDGDVLRSGLCEDLGFTETDRIENMRRLKHLCKILNENENNVICTYILPYEKERNIIKNHLNNCYIIYIKCSLSVCEERDVKGLYKKARLGEIPNFTGIDSEYQEPISPDLIINTDELSINDSTELLLNFILSIKKK